MAVDPGAIPAGATLIHVDPLPEPVTSQDTHGSGPEGGATAAPEAAKEAVPVEWPDRARRRLRASVKAPFAVGSVVFGDRFRLGDDEADRMTESLVDAIDYSPGVEKIARTLTWAAVVGIFGDVLGKRRELIAERRRQHGSADRPRAAALGRDPDSAGGAGPARPAGDGSGAEDRGDGGPQDRPRSVSFGPGI